MRDLKKFGNKKERVMTRVALTLDEQMLAKLDRLCSVHSFDKRTALIYAMINQSYDEALQTPQRQAED